MTRTFIIVEPDPIVSLDVLETLGETYPAAVINVIDNPAALFSAVTTATQPVTVIVNSSIMDDDLHEVLRKSVAQGASIVFLGDIATEYPASRINIPFSSAMIIEALG